MNELTNIITSWTNALSSTDIIAIVSVLILHRMAAMAGMWPYSIFSLTSTAMHEMAHATIALALGANPSFPSITPCKTATGWRLGSVSFTPHLIKNIPIALAPLTLAPLGLWWAAHYMPSSTGVHYAGHAWVSGSLLMASVPSSQDWWIATPALVLVVLVVLGCYLY